MAKVTGPLFSLSASGSVGKTITFGIWKGIAWVRKHFIPENPQTAEQVNMRTALGLMVAYWQGTVTQAQKDDYELGAAGTGQSGYNLYMSRGLKAYIAQLTVAVLPVSVTVAGNYPSDVFTWSAV